MKSTTTEGKEPLVEEDVPEVSVPKSEGEDGCPSTAYPWWNPDNSTAAYQVPHRDDLLTLEQMAMWAQCSGKHITRSNVPKLMLGSLIRYNPRQVLDWMLANADYRFQVTELHGSNS